jgi:small subunit ribosomal protein S20
MPNTKSAERRMRNSARKALANHSVKSRLKTLQRNFLAIVTTGKKDTAVKAFRDVSSALDKAVKNGVIHRATANRKKSRLAVRLGALQVAGAGK